MMDRQRLGCLRELDRTQRSLEVATMAELLDEFGDPLPAGNAAASRAAAFGQSAAAPSSPRTAPAGDANKTMTMALR